jgi:glutaredoxin
MAFDRSRSAHGLVRALAAVALASTALAQRPNDPAACPYCKNDPELMEAAGVVSHGGFEFGSTDTAKVDGLLASQDIRWIESAHFEIGFALGGHKVEQDEKEKIRAELGRLQAALPAVDPKIKVLDPWLRAHLYAQRAEDHWQRMLAILQVKEGDFPDGSRQWNMQGKYMGEGPYLGEKGKYEILILPSEASHSQYLQAHFGLLIKKTQRWNLPEKDTLSVTIHTGQGNLRKDEALHGHLVFNLTINLLDGYKHYSYDTPIWIREGLAHVCEREISPRFNTFDSSEGGIAEMTRKEKWEPEVRRLVASGKAPRMAELIQIKEYAGLELVHHYTTWSMADFLLKSNPNGFACLQDALHGITNEKGIGDGSNLSDVHRDEFKRCLGFSYADFDRAWAEWVLANYGAQ